MDFQGYGLVDAKIVKSNFSGQMMITTALTQYRNQNGKVLALAKSYVHHSPSNEATKARANTKPLSNPINIPTKRSRRSKQTRKKEVMRGNQPRYWEDVNEGIRWVTS